MWVSFLCSAATQLARTYFSKKELSRLRSRESQTRLDELRLLTHPGRMPDQGPEAS